MTKAEREREKNPKIHKEHFSSDGPIGLRNQKKKDIKFHIGCYNQSILDRVKKNQNLKDNNFTRMIL